MVHSRGLVLSLLFLLGGARRSTRIGDAHLSVQLQNDTITNGLEVSAESQDALIPGGFAADVFHRAGLRTGALRGVSKPHGWRAGHLEPHRAAPRHRLGPHPAKVALRALGDPDANKLHETTALHVPNPHAGASTGRAAGTQRAHLPRMQFGNPFEGLKNPFAGKDDGATAVSLTFSFRVEQRGPQSLLGQLEASAAAANTNTAEGIASLCQDISLLLLRRREDWLSCCGTAEHRSNDDDALALYDRLAIREAAKFDDRDDSTTIDTALTAAGVESGTRAAGPTLAVVNVLAVVMGDRTEQMSRSFNGDAIKAKVVLEELAAAASGVDSLFAFELFWVPGSDEEVLDTDEVIMDWPELMPC